MIVLIDIGNTRFKYAFCSPTDAIDSAKTVDSIRTIHGKDNESLTLNWLEKTLVNVSQVIVANVSETKYIQRLLIWAKRHHVSVKLVATEQSYQGVTNGYDQFQRLGVDRWLALIGAHHLFSDKNCLIVDSGTATTIDLLDMQGFHKGGWILPGIDMMMNSVVNSTVLVKGKAEAVEQIAFGTSTSQNLTHASWAATLGAITSAVKLAKMNLNESSVVVFTGGNGSQLQRHFTLSEPKLEGIYVDKLIFIGLSQYIE